MKESPNGIILSSANAAGSGGVVAGHSPLEIMITSEGGETPVYYVSLFNGRIANVWPKGGGKFVWERPDPGSTDPRFPREAIALGTAIYLKCTVDGGTITAAELFTKALAPDYEEPENKNIEAYCFLGSLASDGEVTQTRFGDIAYTAGIDYSSETLKLSHSFSAAQ